MHSDLRKFAIIEARQGIPARISSALTPHLDATRIEARPMVDNRRACRFCTSEIPKEKRSDALYCSESCRRKSDRAAKGLGVLLAPEARFWSRVNKSGPLGCWEWTAGRTTAGYGAFRVNNRAVVSHRYAYELLVGPIPETLQLDHLCRNRACVNPSHIEPVTQVVNLARGISGPATNARKTHCSRGHEFTVENTYSPPANPTHRGCRKCRSLKKSQWDSARRAKRRNYASGQRGEA